jgi:hypothetical protein
MYDIAKQEFDEILHTSTKCNLYQYLVPTFYIQTYLTRPKDALYIKIVVHATNCLNQYDIIHYVHSTPNYLYHLDFLNTYHINNYNNHCI